MTARELLAEILNRGIELATDGDRLRYRPADAVTPELADAITRHKPALIELLARPDDWHIGDPIDWDSEPDPVDCHKCQMFDAWWDASGNRHCLNCDPPTASRRWLGIVEKIRAKRKGNQ